MGVLIRRVGAAAPTCHRRHVANERARKLRLQMTDAERALWWRLRGKQLVRYRFRRQVPIGRYIVDFACLAERLVIELDGGHHAENRRYDAVRGAWLAERGHRVLRFWNPDVLAETDAVVETIWLALSDRVPPTPALPLKGGG